MEGTQLKKMQEYRRQLDEEREGALRQVEFLWIHLSCFESEMRLTNSNLQREQATAGKRKGDAAISDSEESGDEKDRKEGKEKKKKEKKHKVLSLKE